MKQPMFLYKGKIMPYSIIFNSELQIIELKVQGDFSMADAKPLLHDAIEEVKAHNCFRILVGFREGELKFSITEIYYAPQFFASVASTMSNSEIKRALLTKEKTEGFTFFELILANTGYKMKMFHDIDEAKEWLLE